MTWGRANVGTQNAYKLVNVPLRVRRPMSTEGETPTLAKEIEAYLLAHPEAADTIEGIAKWWLARRRYQETRQEVQKALEFLVGKGAVVRNRLSDGRFIYAYAAKQHDPGQLP